MGTRDRILDAAAELMRTRGVARTTTKEIARTAGFSEAALYKHFNDKTDILLSVMRERTPGFAQVDVRPGEGSLTDNLFALTRGALDFYREAFPMMGSLLAEPRLLEAQRRGMRRYGAGPQHAVRRFADYLRAERDLGRVAADADPDAAAALLVGACFQQVFFRYYTEGPSATPVPDETAAALAGAVLRAVSAGDA